MKEEFVPATVLDIEDPGDDIQRRFRYQNTYAAILSVALLPENSEVKKLYCEHHEDVLLEHHDGNYTAIQIKTRLPGLEPFKAKDKEIIKTLNRFMQHEKNFPGKFFRFIIATNHTFWSAKKDGNNLFYLKQLANEQDVPSKLHLLLFNKLKTKVKSIGITIFLNLLKKLHLDHFAPKFDDGESRLIDCLKQQPNMAQQPIHSLKTCAEKLVSKMTNSSSMKHDDDCYQHMLLSKNFKSRLLESQIQTKTVTRQSVIEIIQAGLTSSKNLSVRNYIPVRYLPKETRLIERKMAAGGIPAQSIDDTKDNYHSLTELFLVWMAKYGEQEANKKLAHLKKIAKTECSEAYTNTYKKNELFGLNMLQQAQKNVRERYYKDAKNIPEDCTYEHLLGASAAITEDCHLWWSEKNEEIIQLRTS